MCMVVELNIRNVLVVELNIRYVLVVELGNRNLSSKKILFWNLTS